MSLRSNVSYLLSWYSEKENSLYSYSYLSKADIYYKSGRLKPPTGPCSQFIGNCNLQAVKSEKESATDF